MIRTYDELVLLNTFEERFEYLSLSGRVGDSTFGRDRFLNQNLYHSDEWKRIRREVIVRDMGCDLGVRDREIHGRIIVHHMNPLSKEDIYTGSEFVLDPKYLICVGYDTHNALHYGDISLIPSSKPVERRPNDQIPWR